MARTALVVTPLVARRLRTGTIVTSNTPDVVNGNYWIPRGAEILLLRNTVAGAGVVTLQPSADEHGAIGSSGTWDIAVPAGNNMFVAVGIVRPQGFTQADGRVYINASATTIKIYVISLPQG